MLVGRFPRYQVEEETMPTYEFWCDACQKSITLVLRLEDFEKKNYTCPECRSPKLKQQISTFQTKTSRKS